MTVVVKVLIPAKIAVATDTTQFTSPTGVTTIIDKFTATNYDTVARSITVNLVTLGGSVGNDNKIVASRTLQPNETYTFPELVGHALAPIHTNTSASSTSFSSPSSTYIRRPGVQTYPHWPLHTPGCACMAVCAHQLI